MRFLKPLLLGHRGSPKEARENTLEAFRLALEAGLDGLELDLHRTRDGVLAVYHDFDFAGRPLVEWRWPELRQEAPWMPRLEEVFELVEGYPRAWLNLELKSQPGESDGREEALARALREWEGRERAWVSSFDPLALIRLHRLGVEVPLALLYHLPEVEALLPCLPVRGVHPHYALLGRKRVEELKARGFFVVAWTVNQARVVRELLAWGVDGVIGDLPSELMAARS
ncbi:MAG: glycerophosphodiester phosphodiesterase [Meiothermus sp.]|uniref:glycerophosphodiester phosphodiesterase n=1 Tax=Meiothermus sp. TaxID=1955249 RepID=UPI0025CD60E0|nr:glycerophosphodiester phosphodiesterase [Meiothermus sp.]MCS7057467.1 glycerophosphodiester phosphodiesterase [Meiothermus sp.]MCS7194889.1 glycerophosphodiester phosphodiesterase [Meiothermus sp.]MCX7739523.1 glycerophosphodiester phosphodiesterase [Meiothermus sp.]MDW8091257.1 glycerophosphodiester phosphodiesterase [Meiothermus sp.]MDW8480376.1 glycerophosphodiester phosphodiesterase [Meiothermus sp.]